MMLQTLTNPLDGYPGNVVVQHRADHGYVLCMSQDNALIGMDRYTSLQPKRKQRSGLLPTNEI